MPNPAENGSGKLPVVGGKLFSGSSVVNATLESRAIERNILLFRQGIGGSWSGDLGDKICERTRSIP